MNITNIELTPAEWEQLQSLAARRAERDMHPKLISEETPQNVLRLALGFETRKQGGYRPRKQQPAPLTQQGELNA